MSDNRWSDSPQRTFERMVGPVISTMETARLDAIATSHRRMFLGGPPAAAALLGTGWYFWGGDHVVTAILIVGALLGIGLWMWVSKPKTRFVDEQRQTVLDAVCHHVGDLSYQHDVKSHAFPLKSYSAAKIIPSYTTASLEDLLTGVYRDCAFSLVEADLSRKSGRNNSKTVFAGLLLQINLPRSVPAPINIVRDQSGWGTLGQSVLGWFVPGDPVIIPNDTFEAKYDVYSSDAAGTLSILTPAFIRNFLALPEVLGSDKIMAGFVDTQFLVSVAETPPFLESFSVNRPTTELRASFEHIVEEVKVIHRVIDQLLEGDRYAPQA